MEDEKKLNENSEDKPLEENKKEEKKETHSENKEHVHKEHPKEHTHNEHKEAHKDNTEKKESDSVNLNLWKIATAILAIIVVVMLINSSATGNATLDNPEDVGQEVVGYVTTLSGGQAIPTLKEVTTENGLYKVTLDLGVLGESELYVSPDRKLLLTGIPIDELENTENLEDTEVETQEVRDNIVLEATLDDHVLGQEDAKVTIIEYSDFECPFCGTLNKDTISKIKEQYIDSGQVKIVFRHFPLEFHENAQKSAEASECAAEQGKFWEYHDVLFDNQDNLNIENLKEYASDLSLDTEKFNECLDSGKYESKVLSHISEGIQLGITGTPTSYINGQVLSGAQPFESFDEIIKNYL